MGTAVQVTNSVEPFYGQGHAGQQPDQLQTVLFMVAVMLESVAVLSVIESLILNFPAALGHAEDAPADDPLAREAGEPVRLVDRALRLVWR